MLPQQTHCFLFVLSLDITLKQYQSHRSSETVIFMNKPIVKQNLILCNKLLW